MQSDIRVYHSQMSRRVCLKSAGWILTSSCCRGMSMRSSRRRHSYRAWRSAAYTRPDSHYIAHIAPKFRASEAFGDLSLMVGGEL